ncbi:MAG: hypothetical protein ACR2QF_10230 [Geminicoccaceae bacterium]
MDLAALAIMLLMALYVIAKIIIALAPAIITGCVAGGCWATAWGMGTALPFDDLALLLTVLQMLAASAFTYWFFTEVRSGIEQLLPSRKRKSR